MPADATFTGGSASLRVRLSAVGGLAATGPAPAGEVEDYRVRLVCAGNLVWLDANRDGRQDSGETGLAGVGLRLYFAGPDGLLDTADDRSYATTSAADGRYAFCGLRPGVYRIDVPAPPVALDLAPANQGGDDVRDADGVATPRYAGQGGGPEGPAFTVAAPPAAPLAEDGLLDAPGSLAGYPDRQDDLTFDFGFSPARYDWGDLPDGPYPTLAAVGGAFHRIVAGFALGRAVDAESDGQPTSGATGDGADEDGVVRRAAPNAAGGGWLNSRAADGDGCRFQVTVTGGGVVQLWLDFGSGLAPITLLDAAGAPIPFGFLPAGVHTVACDVPAGTFGGGVRQVAARFRLSSAGYLAATGPAPDGEVEDYLFTFGPNAVVVSDLRATAGGTPGRGLLWLLPAGLLVAALWRRGGAGQPRAPVVKPALNKPIGDKSW